MDPLMSALRQGKLDMVVGALTEEAEDKTSPSRHCFMTNYLWRPALAIPSPSEAV